jgi:hypothetical protein
VAGDGFTWTSNAHSLSKDKKRVLAKSAKGGLSKDATLATTKLSKIVRGRSRLLGHKLPSPSTEQPTKSTYQWTEADKAAENLPGTGRLTSLWPLAVATPTDELGPFGGNAKYNGPERPCQMPCKIDFTRVQLPGKGQILLYLCPEWPANLL